MSGLVTITDSKAEVIAEAMLWGIILRASQAKPAMVGMEIETDQLLGTNLTDM